MKEHLGLMVDVPDFRLGDIASQFYWGIDIQEILISVEDIVYEEMKIANVNQSIQDQKKTNCILYKVPSNCISIKLHELDNCTN